jgi:hypothetical protein
MPYSVLAMPRAGTKYGDAATEPTPTSVAAAGKTPAVERARPAMFSPLSKPQVSVANLPKLYDPLKVVGGMYTMKLV